MKCVKCGARKGKRACPALGGEICPQCCGTHRLKDISCPADCTWLGGLAVLAQGAADVDALEVFRAMRGTVEACAHWTNVRSSDELKVRLMRNAHALLGDKELDERDDWLGETLAVSIYPNAVDGGQKPIDAYLDDRARDLSRAEVAAARAFALSKPVLFKVAAEPSDRDGLRYVSVKDIVTDAPSEVSVEADAPLEANDLLVGHLVTSGAAKHVAFAVPFPDVLSAPAIAAWKEEPGAPSFIRKLRDLVRNHYGSAEHAEVEHQTMFDSLQALMTNPKQWADTPHRMFGGKTPREANAETPIKPGPLEHFIDELEDIAKNNGGATEVGAFDDLRGELGIPRRRVEGYVPIYDPNVEPDPKWFGVHEDTQIESVDAHHATVGDAHPHVVEKGPHATVHALIERLLHDDANDVCGARAAFARLRDQGLTRHEAVHALVDAFAASFFSAYEGTTTERSWVQELPAKFAAIDAALYRGTAA